MKTVQQHAEEAVSAIAKGANPREAYADIVGGNNLTMGEIAALRQKIAEEQVKRLRDLRLCAEILFKHIEKLDGGKCIEKSAPMFKAMIGIEP